MLFWEAVLGRRNSPTRHVPIDPYVLSGTRLPYDKRCNARTKSGRRCKGKIRSGTDFCSFHDPEVTDEQRHENASKGGRTKRRLTHIPGGYLRPLRNRASIGDAMDRLYRELRLGIVTPEMGKVLFDVLCRIDDQYTTEEIRETLFGREVTTRQRGGADRMRPKIMDLLTNRERSDWHQAVANAPESFFRLSSAERAAMAMRAATEPVPQLPKRLPAAS